MNTLTFNDTHTLGYEYVPVGGNSLLGARYQTRLYIVEGNKNYNVGEWDEHLDEDQIKARFGEIIKINQERQYGQHGTVLRRELTPRRATQSERTQQASLRTRYKYPGV